MTAEEEPDRVAKNRARTNYTGSDIPCFSVRINTLQRKYETFLRESQATGSKAALQGLGDTIRTLAELPGAI